MRLRWHEMRPELCLLAPGRKGEEVQIQVGCRMDREAEMRKVAEKEKARRGKIRVVQKIGPRRRRRRSDEEEAFEVEFSPGRAGEAVDREGPPPGRPLAVQERLNAIKLRLPGLTLGEAGGCLVDLLDLFNVGMLHCKSQPMEGKSVFPLPLAILSELSPAKHALLSAVCRSLNSLAGCTDPQGRSSHAGRMAVKQLAAAVEVCESWSEVFQDVNFSDFLRVKGIDYKGDEVKLAVNLSWECLAPALPDEVGKLKLAELCTLGTRFYVDHFEDFLVPSHEMSLGKPPRVFADAREWPSICQGLVGKGICEVVPLDELFHIQGQPLLNGMFGVGKGEFVNGKEALRLIMNLIPLNRNCRGISGDVGTLPQISGMSSFVLEGSEVALLSSEDIRCFFYLSQVPPAWKRFLGFNKLVPEDLVPSSLTGRKCVLAAKVLPMGFLNSVSIAQHVHRNPFDERSRDPERQEFPRELTPF